MGKDSSSRNRQAGATTRQYNQGLSRASVRTTYQLAAEVSGRHKDLNEAWSMAFTATMQWLMTKFQTKMPPVALQGKSFEIDEYSRKLEAVGVPTEGIWTARLTHPDEPFEGREAVAGRSWVTEVALARQSDKILFGCRVIAASAAFCDDPVAFTRPRLVVEVARAAGLVDRRPVDGKSWLVDSEAACTELYSFLIYQKRTLPVVIVSGLAPRQMEQVSTPYILDPDKLARELQGFAHVVRIPYDAAYRWTDMVGKAWSTYRGAVRVTWPRIRFDDDSPFLHELTFADKIFWWREQDLNGEAAYSKHLRQLIAEKNATSAMSFTGLAFLADARVRQAQVARNASLEQKDWKALLEDENAALRDKIAEKEKERDEYAGLMTVAENERDQAKGELKQLRGQVHALRAQLAAQTGQSADASVPICASLDEIPDWVAQYIGDRVALHSRALRGLSKGKYKDIELVCRALLLLANEYFDMRTGKIKPADFEEAAAKLHVEYRGSITEERAGQEGDTYFIQWPQGTNTRCFLKHHLRKGNDRDERNCLAIYFLWDDETQRVVVGWLPSHLENQLT